MDLRTPTQLLLKMGEVVISLEKFRKTLSASVISLDSEKKNTTNSDFMSWTARKMRK